MKRKLIAAIGVATMIVGIAACGSDKKDDDKKADAGSSSAATTDKTITVWLTVDAQHNWPELVKSADDAIIAKHPGLKVKHEYYAWPDKNAKLDAVLATDKTPDVVEMGNTEMVPYMAEGAFAELDPSKFENSAQWLDGLKQSVNYDGKTYGVPYYAAARIASWRKDIAAAAGVKDTPKNWAELTGDLDKIQAKEGAKFNAWYQPSRDWYAGLSFVYDAGGAIATNDGGQWKGSLESPAAIQGLTAWKNAIGKYMHGDLTKDESDRYIVYGQGKSAMIYAPGWEAPSAADPKFDKTGGKLKDNLVNFVMPGPSGKALPVFLGGSDLAVPSKSKNTDLASEWINDFTNTQAQTTLMSKGNLPNNNTQLATLKADPANTVTATAAESSWFVPTAPGWGSVEKAQTLQTMLQNIATGKQSVADAAKAADAAMDKVLNVKN
ncbi:extracellular solute-binding protein [Streptomyces cocklensis]|uniref:Carbohydrate ABC transporter substrate-binding protein, CUT1 family n=1 Tax=Actinacidiphila cocklensis TaxID=887465 RepID=A0A9W4E8V1_9ACTN|nr:extracellular solute-binding protein [Actinacidiphila cocklensis]MDD1061249.1 extracellular solute-binding protein [Actinacidiphila cocklensis]WSX76910.1 extracellular solute-binding protein [Streptomyces sp. NBC_00899]CAG6395804.1 Carbohydrate ABC transporter substrate-binding protein, CUT1 family [Actinacidiphila cocklensis]